MRILIVHRYLWPEPISVLPLMFGDIISWHQSQGHDVSAVIGSAPNMSKQRSNRFGEDVVMEVFKSKPDREHSLIGRGINSLKLFFGGVKHIYLSKPYDYVYLVSYPPFFALFVMIAAKLKPTRTRFIYYLQDNMSYRLTNQILRWVYEWSQMLIIRLAWKTITISPSMKSRLVGPAQPATGIAEKIIIIPNYAVELEFDVHRPAIQKYDIIFAGGIGPAQNLCHFLNAMALARLHKLRVAFFGSGTELANLKAHAAKLALAVTFNTPIGRIEVAHEIAASRFGLVGAKADLMSYAFPSKLASYTAVGTPGLVMCSEDEPMGDWIKSNGLGILISPDNLEDAARQLAACFSDTTKDDFSHTRKNAESVFGKLAFLNRLSSIF